VRVRGHATFALRLFTGSQCRVWDASVLSVARLCQCASLFAHLLEYSRFRGIHVRTCWFFCMGVCVLSSEDLPTAKVLERLQFVCPTKVIGAIPSVRPDRGPIVYSKEEVRHVPLCCDFMFPPCMTAAAHCRQSGGVSRFLLCTGFCPCSASLGPRNSTPGRCCQRPSGVA
jgi:hypothetical protein